MKNLASLVRANLSFITLNLITVIIYDSEVYHCAVLFNLLLILHLAIEYYPHYPFLSCHQPVFGNEKASVTSIQRTGSITVLYMLNACFGRRWEYRRFYTQF
jgi:hypothetical protein